MNKIKRLSANLGQKARHFLASCEGICAIAALSPMVGAAAGIACAAIGNDVGSAEFFAQAASNTIPAGLFSLFGSIMARGLILGDNEPRHSMTY